MMCGIVSKKCNMKSCRIWQLGRTTHQAALQVSHLENARKISGTVWKLVSTRDLLASNKCTRLYKQQHIPYAETRHGFSAKLTDIRVDLLTNFLINARQSACIWNYAQVSILVCGLPDIWGFFKSYTKLHTKIMTYMYIQMRISRKSVKNKFSLLSFVCHFPTVMIQVQLEVVSLTSLLLRPANYVQCTKICRKNGTR